MDLIGTYFLANGIDFDAILLAEIRTINHIYMKPSVMKKVNYVIPGRGVDEEYDYIRIPIQDKLIDNVFNIIPLKSDFADIVSYADAVVTLDDADYVDGIGVGFHGRNIMMNNAQDETIIQLQYSEIDSSIANLYEEFYRYLRQCYYYAYVSDFNSMYQSMNMLSAAKSNIVSKNVHTEKTRRTGQVFEIGLLKI